MNKKLIEALRKANALIARGIVEGAYVDTCGGDSYARHFLEDSAALIKESEATG
jgi:hypothetical protein